MNELQQAMLTYGIIMLTTIILVGAYTKNFLWKYALARTSGGRKVLVEVRTNTGNYLVVGTMDEDSLKYKNRQKEQKLVTNVPRAAVQQFLGVSWVRTDDATNTVLDPNKGEVSGHDAIKMDMFVKRALQKPSLDDKKMIALVIIVLIIAVGVVANIYLTYKVYTIVQQMGPNVVPQIAAQVTPSI